MPSSREPVLGGRGHRRDLGRPLLYCLGLDRPRAPPRGGRNEPELLWSIAGVVAILGFVAYGPGLSSPTDTLRQLRAGALLGRAGAVAGKLVQGSDQLRRGGAGALLRLEDDHGEKLLVAYKGLKPGTSTRPPSVVAIGRYQAGQLEGRKAAREVPSKYQGVEEKGYGSRTS